MAPQSDWCVLGPVERFTGAPLTAARIGTTRIVITHQNGEFGALSGVCNHAGGPLAQVREQRGDSAQVGACSIVHRWTSDVLPIRTTSPESPFMSSGLCLTHTIPASAN